MPQTWQSKLTAATTEAEVIAVVKDYVATLSPGDIARLPEPCRPRKFSIASDVTDFSLALVRHDCMTDGATTRLVLRLSDFFAKASLRLVHVRGTSLVQDDD